LRYNVLRIVTQKEGLSKRVAAAAEWFSHQKSACYLAGAALEETP